MDGEFVPWEQAQVHVLTHTLHYGAGCFEGERAYKTDRGPAIFRLQEHTERLFYSMGVIGMELPFSREAINEATVELVRRNELEHCYIRPLAFYGYGKMGLNPTGAPARLMIACWPWGAYLPHEMVDLKVSSYIRIHPRSTVADAKICGHYVNSILAVRELIGTHYHEALFLDEQQQIAEGPGENFFIIKGTELITPPAGTILEGITRATIMEIAQAEGLSVSQRVIPLQEALGADEAFYTGTAAEVTPIRSIDDNTIGHGEVGEITRMLKTKYLDIVAGKDDAYEHYLTYVNK